MANGTRRMRWLLLGVLMVGIAGAVLVVTGVVSLPRRANATTSETAKAATKAEKPPVTVTVAAVKEMSIQRTVDAVGTFQGLEEVSISPKITGRVVKIHHDVQDIVHTGDVLLEIDPTDYKLAVDEASKAMTSELAKIGQTSLPPENVNAQEFVKQLPNYVRAENVESNAKAKVERAKLLRESKALSQEDFDQILTDYQVAIASRRQVELDALATLASARYKNAQLLTAQQRLADTRVEVPAPKQTVDEKGKAGPAPEKTEYVVAVRDVSEGELFVASMIASKGVYRLVIDQTLKLMATLPERYVGQVHVDQVVEVRVEAYPDQVFQGRIARISPTVDRLSRTFQIEVRVPNEKRLLKAGGFAKLSVLTQMDSRALTVPPEAVVSFAGINKVYVINQGKAHVIEVATSTEGQGWIEVVPKTATDLAPGVKVITSGFTQLAEDVPVRLREAGRR